MSLRAISVPTFLLKISLVFAQTEEESEPAIMPPDISETYTPLVLNTGDEKGYLRFINWNQFTCTVKNREDGSLSTKPQLKRVRFLAYARFLDRITIVTHFGVNNLTADDMHPTGQSAETQLFLHGAWSEFAVAGEAVSIGGGLHYYNGLSRITNASTLNFLTYDNYRQAWAQLGLSDQFARHLGVFVKGMMGRINYHLSLNDPLSNTVDSYTFTGMPGTIAYVGKEFFPEKASMSGQGYVDYQFLNLESNALPYRTGTYLGSKKVFNLGAGFFSHPDGVVSISEDSTVRTHNVRHFAFDAFYDSPLPSGGAVTAYAVYYNFNYGPDYCYNRIYGNGHSVYVQAGYLVPPGRGPVGMQPYVSYSFRNYQKYNGVSNSANVGLNLLFMGHHAKVTMEYQSQLPNYNHERPPRNNALVIQAMLYL